MIDVSIRNFTRAVNIAATVTEKRNPIPILGTMKVRANGRLEIEATDLDMVATIAVPCETEGHDKGTFHEFILSDAPAVVAAISAAGGETASFDVIKGTPADKRGDNYERSGFTVRAGQLVRSTRHGMSVEDFPTSVAQMAEREFSATLSADVLRQIERISAAISKEETRYYLNGVHMRRLADNGDGWTYRFTATDGHRLMMVDVPLPDATGELPALIMPRKFLTCLFRHFRRAEGPLALSAGRGTIPNREDSTAPARYGVPRVALAGKVGEADVSFTSKVIDGTYPDTDRVIPTSCDFAALFNVGELRQAVLATAGSARTHSTPALAMTFDADGIALRQIFHVEGITAEYRVACQHNATPGFVIGFRAHYVLDMLAACTGDQVRFGIGNEAGPVLINDVSDPSFTGVLMPMRV